MCDESWISRVRGRQELFCPFRRPPFGRVEIRVNRDTRIPTVTSRNDDLRTEGRRLVLLRD